MRKIEVLVGYAFDRTTVDHSLRGVSHVFLNMSQIVAKGDLHGPALQDRIPSGGCLPTAPPKEQGSCAPARSLRTSRYTPDPHLLRMF